MDFDLADLVGRFFFRLGLDAAAGGIRHAVAADSGVRGFAAGVPECLSLRAARRVEEGPHCARAFQAQHVFLVDASDFTQFFLASFSLTLCSQVICEAEGG